LKNLESLTQASLPLLAIAVMAVKLRKNNNSAIMVNGEFAVFD
jgi:hypothetical protein